MEHYNVWLAVVGGTRALKLNIREKNATCNNNQLLQLRRPPSDVVLLSLVCIVGPDAAALKFSRRLVSRTSPDRRPKSNRNFVQKALRVERALVSHT